MNFFSCKKNNFKGFGALLSMSQDAVSAASIHQNLLKPSEMNFFMFQKFIFKDFELSWSLPKNIIGKQPMGLNFQDSPWRPPMEARRGWIKPSEMNFFNCEKFILIIRSSACHVLLAQTYTATHHLRDATLHIGAQLLVGLKPLETNFFNGKKLICKDFEFSLSCRRRPFLRFPITISYLLQSRKVAF